MQEETVRASTQNPQDGPYKRHRSKRRGAGKQKKAFQAWTMEQEGCFPTRTMAWKAWKATQSSDRFSQTGNNIPLQEAEEVLEKLENERLQFDVRLNEEKQKWEEALDISKQEREMLEITMKDQMEKWREEQQAERRKMMENKVKEEKDIQVEVLNEKIMLEAKLEETEHTLKEQEAKAETSQAILSANTTSETIASESTSERVLFNLDQYEKQLTCTICSELFVKAMTLGCAHTFCHHCIRMWNICPVCRKPVMSMVRSLVLDNFVESMIENLPPELKNRRKKIIQEREVAETVLKRESDETQEDGY